MHTRTHRRPFSRAIAGLFTLLGLLFGACSGGGGGGGGDNGARAQLVSLSLQPSNPSVALGFTRAISVTGIYSDQTTRDLSAVAQWSVTGTAVLDIEQGGAVPSLLRSLSVGSTTITATAPGTAISISTTAAVTPATLVAITVEPPLASVPRGYRRQFTAIGRFSDATTQDLTREVIWSTTDPSFAGMDDQPGTSGRALGLATGSTTVRARHAASGINGGSTLNVTQAVLALLAITPGAPSAALGYEAQCTATGTFSDGSTQDLTAAVQWSSADVDIATVDNGTSSGLIRTVAVGNASISATEPLTGVTAAATMDVTPAVLVSLAVTPWTPALALGHGQQFTATGTFSDNSTQDLTTAVTWNTTRPDVATIGNAVGSHGLATSLGVGTTTISATVPLSAIADATTLEVTPAVLVSLAVTPEAAQLPLGYTQQFTAVGTFSDDSTQDLTAAVAWSTVATGIASVGNGSGNEGLATGITVGTTAVLAEAPGTGISGTTSLAITPALLVSLGISPTLPSVALGFVQQFTATGVFSDSSTRDLTDAVTWISTEPTVASIDNTGPGAGRATSSGTGTTTILAYVAGTSALDSTTLTVTPAVLVDIAVAPTAPQVPLGYERQFTAIGTFSDSTTQDLTGVVTWSSTNPATALISNAASTRGLATTMAIGTSTITATDPGSGVIGTTTLTVLPATLVAVSVGPALPDVVLGRDVQFTAVGIFSDHSVLDLTSLVTWSSDQPWVASIANSSGNHGRATGLATGTTTITATAPGTTVNGDTTLTVLPAALVAIEVTPALPELALGRQQQFTATGRYSDNSTTDLTDVVTWSSTATGAAVISNATGSAGLATGTAIGTTTISAVEPASGLLGSTTLSITPAALVSIAVTPSAPELALGFQQQFTAIGTFSDNTTRDLTETVTWSSSATATATIANTVGSRGRCLTAATGTTTIAATDAATGIAGSTVLNVTPAVLVAIGVTPGNQSLALGYSQQFTATGVFSDSTTQDLTDAVLWSSSQTTTATIGNAAGTQGLATSATTGTTTIAATEPGTGIVGSTSLLVTPAVLVSLTPSPNNPGLALGYGRQFTALGTFSDNSTSDLTTAVTWTSSVEAVATISNAPGSAGLATSANQGATTIVATDPGSGVFGYTNLNVTPAVMVSIAITPDAPSRALGYPQPFTATATFSDGTTQDVTSTVTWESSDSAVATISNAPGSHGLATGVTVGTTTVRATDAGSGTFRTTTLTMTPAVLVGITLTPNPTTVSLGGERQFVASGRFSDNTTQDVTEAVTWSTSDAAVAVVSNAPGSRGLADSTGIGSAVLFAVDPTTSVLASASLQVTAAVLVSLTVTPANTTMAPGFTQQMTAIGVYSDNTTQDLTTQVTWSSTTGAATIGNTPGSIGLATSVGAGPTTIGAVHPLSGLAASTSLVVGDRIVHRRSTTVTRGSGSLSLTLTIPPLTAPGDQMLAAIAVRASSPTVNAPGGWTLVRRSVASGTTGNTLLLYRRTAISEEPGNPTWTFSTSAGAVGSISTFQGVNTTTPVDVSNSRTTSSSLSHTTTSVTTLTANTMVVTFHAIGSSATWTAPSGMTEIVDLQSGAPGTAAGVGMLVSWQFQPSIGATGARTAVAAGTAAVGHACTIVLRD
jgi:trimeric autotransporter adhesin